VAVIGGVIARLSYIVIPAEAGIHSSAAETVEE